jgi:hypothetical protein
LNEKEAQEKEDQDKRRPSLFPDFFFAKEGPEDMNGEIKNEEMINVSHVT